MCDTPTAKPESPKPLDLTKPLQTVCGWAVRLFDRGPNAKPSEAYGLPARLAGVIRYPVDGYDRVSAWFEDGRHAWTRDCANDPHWHAALALRNVPEPAAFDPTKPAWTRDGRRAFVWVTPSALWPLTGMVVGTANIEIWRANGHWRISDSADALDLTNEAPSR